MKKSLIVFVLVLSVSCKKFSDDQPGAEPSDLKSVSSSAQTNLQFSNACSSGSKITIAAVGDVLFHGPLQSQGAHYGYRSIWSQVQSYILNADVSYANLEGPTASDYKVSGTAKAVNVNNKVVADPGVVYDKNVYTSFPMFNYPARVIDELKASGFDVLSTANNHSLDRRSDGVDFTTNALTLRGMPHTGMRNNASQPWYTRMETKGVKVGWLACTFSTNGIPDTNPEKSILMCFTKDGGNEPNPEVLNTISSLKKTGNVDAVILTPHWGTEYQHSPNSSQRKLAKAALDHGAAAIIGNHPHVLQPWEKYTDINGEEKFVIYSLGNFVSGQVGTAKRTSGILFLGLTKTSAGKVIVNGARILPTYMSRSQGMQLVPLDRKNPEHRESYGIVDSLYGVRQQLVKGEAVKTDLGCAR